MKPAIILTALSLSIGWGIRGNFGHEIGAMAPGALAAMAIALLSGRDDWRRKVAWFGMFGALGWAFGGSMSYGQVIGYTHSGHSMSVLYGFTSLFLIGFLWGAIGGAGTALPAILTREKLAEFLPPLMAVFIVWFLQDIVENTLIAVNSDFRQESPLYWYDTDWLAAATAIAAILALAAVRRRICDPSRLMLHMAAGWWIGFLVLVPLLGWRMTPPRGDNWAGCLGMTIGLWIYLQRSGLRAVTLASVLTGFFGGFGFAFATFLRLFGFKTGWQTNWHSFMEQSYGFINGLGIAVAMLMLASRLPVEQADESGDRSRRYDLYAIAFVLIAVPWLNLRQNPAFWIRNEAVPEIMAGLPAQLWFEVAFWAFAVVVVRMMIAHLRKPVALVPATWQGKGQLLYLVFLWLMVAGNFEREIVAFRAQRLITEWVIFLNACAASWLALRYADLNPVLAKKPATDFPRLIRKTALAGLVFTIVSVTAQWAGIRALWGNQQAGGGKPQIRFGQSATATTEKPRPGQPHP
ncbi:MAG: hypothetical protein IPM66_18560 [Acidobacteriota bacterium]|nr:MAG: hypothetical protein IPM66_18560 [Acidobacteriota bacterium]